MRLDELMTQKYDWTLKSSWNNGYLNGQFKTADGSHVSVSLTFDPLEHADASVMLVTFTRDLSQALTGGRDAFKIFATVIDIVKAGTKKHKPEFIVYAADKDEKSRVSVYDKMTDKFKGPDYTKITNMSQIEDEQARNDLARWIADAHEPDYAITILARKDMVR